MFKGLKAVDKPDWFVLEPAFLKSSFSEFFNNCNLKGLLQKMRLESKNKTQLLVKNLTKESGVYDFKDYKNLITSSCKLKNYMIFDGEGFSSQLDIIVKLDIIRRTTVSHVKKVVMGIFTRFFLRKKEK